MVEIIGWAGAVLFALCAAPQAIYCYKNKSAEGLSWPFLLMWSGGEILTLLYIVFTTADIILLVNYVFNLLCLVVILWYKIRKG